MVMGSKARWTAREVGKGVGRHWPFLPIHQFLREYMGCQLAVSFQLAHCTDHLLTAQIMGILGYVQKKTICPRSLSFLVQIYNIPHYVMSLPLSEETHFEAPTALLTFNALLNEWRHSWKIKEFKHEC